MPKKPPRSLPVIGWREWIEFPQLGLPLIKAKVDTGAKSSSLHAFDVVIRPSLRGDRVEFKVIPSQRINMRPVLCRAKFLGERSIKSSNGASEVRPVIETVIRLFDEQWPIELTLSDRMEMNYRLLLGRAAFKDRYLVDVGRSFVAKAKTKKKRRPSEKTP